MVEVVNTSPAIYAAPRHVTDISQCYFYHSMSIPGHGEVEGQWDLRPGLNAYLGGVDFGHCRVLDLGTADGFLSWHLENLGANVVSYDLSDSEPWDVVPFAQYDHRRYEHEFSEDMRRLNNAYWFCHRAFNSKNRMVYGHVAQIPREIGPVDVTIFGSILLHVRDPFAALESGLRLTRETVIVTDALGRLEPPRFMSGWRAALPGRLGKPAMVFLPDWRQPVPESGWWELSPHLVREFLGVLGFEKTTTTYHRQLFLHGEPRRVRRLKCFTVVGTRTRPLPA